MKRCQKIYCDLPSIPRGKYCEIHRSVRRRIAPIFEEPERIHKEDTQRIVNDRLIREEQEDEYKETVRLDRENFEKIEYEKILEISRTQYFNDKKMFLLPEPEHGEDFFNIRIKLPNNTTITRKFSIISKIKDIRDYIEVYFYENGINIVNYILVSNFPHNKFTEKDSEVEITSLGFPKNFILYLQDLDS